jgi:hypothetical protein
MDVSRMYLAWSGISSVFTVGISDEVKVICALGGIVGIVVGCVSNGRVQAEKIKKIRVRRSGRSFMNLRRIIASP